MTIVIAHNYYQHRGGEDAVFEAECALLESRGHRVIPYTVHNNDVQSSSLFASLHLASKALYNRSTYDALAALFRHEKPDVVHVHNTLPLLSPAVYFAAHDAGIPVVQTLHNYRLLCPNALFFREGRVCEDCLGKPFAFDAIVHRCYRSSHAASAVVAGVSSLHRMLGTWHNRIHTYIALTEFARQKFVAGGLPASKIVVKPNFVLLPDSTPFPAEPLASSSSNEKALRTSVLFVGRLSPEKGIVTLLRAWKLFMKQIQAAPTASHLNHTAILPELRIVGDGPMEQTLRALAANDTIDAVLWLGRKSNEEVIRLMQQARCLVFSSELYETFGKSMIEAFSCGTPVICSRLGAMEEIVEDGITGFHCHPSDPTDLAHKLHTLWNLSEERYAAMSRAALSCYKEHYTATRNAEQLEAIYKRAIGDRHVKK
jgi:glycosyltransferase involved in cell wall biosynthesis